MNVPNQWMTDLIARADAKGWIVVAFSNTKPCSVTLHDANGVAVTVTDDYGLRIPEYLERLEPTTPYLVEAVRR